MRQRRSSREVPRETLQVGLWIHTPKYILVMYNWRCPMLYCMADVFLIDRLAWTPLAISCKLSIKRKSWRYAKCPKCLHEPKVAQLPVDFLEGMPSPPGLCQFWSSIELFQKQGCYGTCNFLIDAANNVSTAICHSCWASCSSNIPTEAIARRAPKMLCY